MTCIFSTFTLAPVGRVISEKERLNDGLLLKMSSTSTGCLAKAISAMSETKLDREVTFSPRFVRNVELLSSTISSMPRP